jgi:hypothetical protein
MQTTNFKIIIFLFYILYIIFYLLWHESFPAQSRTWASSLNTRISWNDLVSFLLLHEDSGLLFSVCCTADGAEIPFLSCCLSLRFRSYGPHMLQYIHCLRLCSGFKITARMCVQCWPKTNYYVVQNLWVKCRGMLNRVSSAGVATGYGLDFRGVEVRVPVRSRIFTFPYRPDRIWDPPSLLSSGYWGPFPGGKAAGGMELTTYLQLVPRSRKHGYTCIYTRTSTHILLDRIVLG